MSLCKMEKTINLITVLKVNYMHLAFGWACTENSLLSFSCCHFVKTDIWENAAVCVTNLRKSVRLISISRLLTFLGGWMFWSLANVLPRLSQVAGAADHWSPRCWDQHGLWLLSEELPAPAGSGQGAGGPGGGGHLPHPQLLPGPSAGLHPRTVRCSLCVWHGGECCWYTLCQKEDVLEGDITDVKWKWVRWC